MQVAYAIACVVVHQRAHQLVARHSPVPVGEMLFAIGFTSGYRFSVTSSSVSCWKLSVIALVRGGSCRYTCGIAEPVLRADLHSWDAILGDIRS